MPPRKSDVRPATPVAAEEASPPAKAPQAQDKQDKQEKKDKDKDKGKGGEDPVTIEVRASFSYNTISFDAVLQTDIRETQWLTCFIRT